MCMRSGSPDTLTSRTVMSIRSPLAMPAKCNTAGSACKPCVLVLPTRAYLWGGSRSVFRSGLLSSSVSCVGSSIVSASDIVRVERTTATRGCPLVTPREAPVESERGASGVSVD